MDIYQCEICDQWTKPEYCEVCDTRNKCVYCELCRMECEV